MQKENKHTLMIWAIVILAVMNVATLATILYHQYQPEKTGENKAQLQQTEEEVATFSGRYFRDKLNMNGEQMSRFREFNQGFRQQARNTAIEMSEKRKRMFMQMKNPQRDTVKLNMLSDSIGYLHSHLKKLTYRYYLDIKDICTPEQQKQLEQLFQEIFTNDALPGPGRGGHGGPQHGKRFSY
jgi:Spy/CpxP family protein refolding chaperone